MAWVIKTNLMQSQTRNRRMEKPHKTHFQNGIVSQNGRIIGLWPTAGGPAHFITWCRSVLGGIPLIVSTHSHMGDAMIKFVSEKQENRYRGACIADDIFQTQIQTFQTHIASHHNRMASDTHTNTEYKRKHIYITVKIVQPYK